MTASSVENFFDNTGGGSGAPSIKLSQPNDGVKGEILDQFMAPAYHFGTKNQKTDSKTGAPIEQLVVIVQTSLRNWDRVAKIPLVDPEDRSKGEKPASEDDGRRAIYIEPFTNIHAAVGAAVVKATGKKGPLLNGGTLGVKITELRDTGKGNPLKVHDAVYEPPVASGQGFFGDSNTAQSAPAAQSQSAPAPAQDPWSGAPAGGAATEQAEEPPF